MENVLLYIALEGNYWEKHTIHISTTYTILNLFTFIKNFIEEHSAQMVHSIHTFHLHVIRSNMILMIYGFRIKFLRFSPFGIIPESILNTWKWFLRRVFHSVSTSVFQFTSYRYYCYFRIYVWCIIQYLDFISTGTIYIERTRKYIYSERIANLMDLSTGLPKILGKYVTYRYEMINVSFNMSSNTLNSNIIDSFIIHSVKNMHWLGFFR